MAQEKISASAGRTSTSREATNEEQKTKLKKARQEAIKDARKRLSARLATLPKIARQIAYAKGGHIEAVFCKGCGVQIAGLIEAEKNERIERINKQTVVYKRLVQAHFPNYREIRLVFDNQTDHITHCCVKCIPKIMANPQEAYNQDLAQWSEDERRGLGAVRWDQVVDRNAIDAQELE